MRTVISSKNSFRRGGFTLTELLVAIALLMIIMVSVATIFSSSGQAVSVGMAITEQNRAMATFAQQLQQDLVGYADKDPFGAGTGMVPVNEPPGPSAPPFLFIHSISALGQPDRATELSGAAARRFRLDSIGFFTKGAFQRQTGSPAGSGYVGIVTDPPVLVDRMANFTNAFVWYGHLRQPDNGANWLDPGAGTSATNPYNFYANQWILGRRALLLANVRPIGSAPGTEGYVWGGDHAAWFHGRWWDSTQLGQTPATGAQGGQWDPQNFAPFGYDSKLAYMNRRSSFPMVVDNGAPLPTGTVDNTQEVVSSRYDIVGMNREQGWEKFADIAEQYQDNYITGLADYRAWPWVRRYFSQRHCGSLLESLDIEWAAGTIPNNKKSFAETAAKAVPALLRSCTNFIVEFAGDYVSQDPTTGALTGVVGPYPNLNPNDPSTWHFDGVIDFDVINGVRQIHWYGMPRDINGDNDYTTNNSGDVTLVAQMRQGGRPVMPAPPPAAQAVPFESAMYAGGTQSCEWGWTRDMLSLPATQAQPYAPLSFAPKLIRVIVQVNDPQGRVVDDMTREYVFPVKHN